MKIYKITSYFHLNDKPQNLIKFEESYGDIKNTYHVTFKFPTFVSFENLGRLTEVLMQTSKATKPFNLIFDTYFFDRTYSGNIILLACKNSDEVTKFQKSLIEKLQKFGSNIRSEEAQFEENFIPHITLARKISDENLDAIKSQLPQELQVSTRIKDFTLTLADEWTQVSKKEEFLFSFQNK